MISPDGRTYVHVPSIEDIIVIKLSAPQKKHSKDVRHALRTSISDIDMERLKRLAKEAGVEKQLSREMALSTVTNSDTKSREESLV